MKSEEVVETYYFVRSKKKTLKPLISEFPMLFTEEKKVPLNFQLKMTELSEGNTQRRHSERKFRLSMQSRINKIELRRNIMKIVLRNKSENFAFEFLNDCASDLPVWYYIEDPVSANEPGLLQGPLTNHGMQELFEKGVLKPTTLVKKKLMPDFVQMRYLLNKFCRLRAIQSVDEGHFYDYLSKQSPKKTEAPAVSHADEEWLGVIGKKIEVDPHFLEAATHSGGAAPDWRSSISGSYGRERRSFVMSRESYQDFKSNPNRGLFDKLDVKKSGLAAVDPQDRKSFANNTLREPVNSKGRFDKAPRPRHATSSYKPK